MTETRAQIRLRAWVDQGGPNDVSQWPLIADDIDAILSLIASGSGSSRDLAPQPEAFTHPETGAHAAGVEKAVAMLEVDLKHRWICNANSAENVRILVEAWRALSPPSEAKVSGSEGGA